jgi:formylglycine-generating enzyme required for sulfatase activity
MKIQVAVMMVVVLLGVAPLQAAEPSTKPAKPAPAAKKAKVEAPPAVAPTTAPADGLTLDVGGGVKMLFAKIPAGSFLMGSPENEKARSSDEGPQHEVTISKPFFMGLFPVTQGQYQQVMGDNPSVAAKGPEYPVDNVPWEMAVAFCKKMSAQTGKTVRLPTEAEFEYATRAGTTTRYYYGDDPDYKLMSDHAWWNKNCKDDLQPVGLKKPNPWGLHDVYGIVWQWCSDWYGDTYPSEKQTDPQGPATGQYRVMRGGCWLTGAHAMDDKQGRMLSRSALRGIPSWYSYFAPGSAAKLGRVYDQVGRIGFRVVVEENR